MNEADAERALRNILSSLNITKGDTILLGINVGRVPLPKYTARLTRQDVKDREQKWCAFVYTVLMDTLGEDGTLLVPTFSFAYCSGDTPYVHEKTPSEMGPFTEFVRQQPGAIRSVHPILSVSGVGSHAQEILGHCGRYSFGVGSPFGRLKKYNTKFLNLGCGYWESLTYVHQLEQEYGVQYRYYKAFHHPVQVNGELVPGPWMALLRHRGIDIDIDVRKFEDRLRDDGCLLECNSSATQNLCATLEDIERVGFNMLAEDPCTFLEQPYELHYDDSELAQNPVIGRKIVLNISVKEVL